MQTFASLMRSTVRILFARGSPERIQIAPLTLPVSLLLAALGYATAHWFLLTLSAAQIVVSLFCLLMLLAASTAWITRYVPRRRLSQVLVAMLLIVALAGVALGAVGLLPAFAGRNWLALPVAATMLYGLSHCLGFALRCQQFTALLWCLAFAGLVYGLYALLESQLALVFAERGALAPALRLWA